MELRALLDKQFNLPSIPKVVGCRRLPVAGAGLTGPAAG